MKVTSIAAILVPLLMLPGEAAATQAEPASGQEIVHEAVEKQKDRPYWFVPFTALLPDMPFAYQAASTLTVQKEGDAELKMSAITREEIVLGADWEQVRTTFTGAGGSGRDHNTLTGIRTLLFDRYRQHLAAMEKQRLAESRSHRQSTDRIWTEFLQAFTFRREGNRIRDGRPLAVVAFGPRPEHTYVAADVLQFFSKVEGELWIDLADYEIARLQYAFTADSPEYMSLGPVRKKTRFTMDLAKSLDDAWLPVRAETEIFRRNGAGVSHDTYTVEFSRYRKFGVDVRIQALGPELSEGEEP